MLPPRASSQATLARKRRPFSARRHAAGILGGAIVLTLVVVAIFAPWIAPYGPTEGELLSARLPPAWHEGGTREHLLGTDQLGQDILSRIVYGSRVSLTVGLFGVLLAASLGILFGVLAGYLGGRTDALIMGLTNLLLSVPYLVIVIVVATLLGRSLENVILLFGVTGSPIFIRLVRGEVLRLKEKDFVEAARSLGASHARVVFRHLLPAFAGPLLTLATFEMSAMIFYEAGLSFLGLSVPPEVPSWGNMLALGRRFLTTHPWLAIYPGLVIAITALGINLLGEWLRDVLDPRSSYGRP
jgi:ABC-type dipeptide/oligopeptide/nickel transport system permease subunit